MNFKYNDVLTRSYKNAEIEIVVEDDVITTAKVFIDNDCVACDDITTDKGEDVKYNRANYEKVMEMMQGFVDSVWEKNVAVVTR
jgi:hypothetical protein